MGGILDFLLPREKKFIKMLIKQSDIVLQGAHEFNMFISDFKDLDETAIIERRSTIKETEHRGDRITRKITDSLHETFITPIDREDILSLTNSLDDVLDLIDETTAKIVVYKIKNMPKYIEDFSRNILKCCQIIKNSMICLTRYDRIQKAVSEIHNIETESDKLFRRCIRELFETTKDAKDIIKFKDIYESVEEAIDMCQRVSDIFRHIVVKNG